MSEHILTFVVDGEHTFLSNFYPSPIADGEDPTVIYQTVEHYFAAQKTLDPYEKQHIVEAATPGKAKRLGRTATLRPDWESIKFDVMRSAIAAKFHHESDFAHQLLQTGEAFLCEGNTWGDRVWGRVNNVGNNWLGTILMARRAELRWILGDTWDTSDS